MKRTSTVERLIIAYECQDGTMLFFNRPTKDGIIWSDEETAQILTFGNVEDADRMVTECEKRGLFPKGFEKSRIRFGFRDVPADGGAAAKIYKDIIEGKQPDFHIVEWHP